MFEENDAFEIIDYTTATDLERFISDLENLIKQWGLSTQGDAVKQNISDEHSEIISFAQIDFRVCFHGDIDSVIKNSVVQNNDNSSFIQIKQMQENLSFSNQDHIIKNVYGLTHFITISTASEQDIIATEDVLKMLTSSVTVAAGNTSCICPIFVQSSLYSRQLFQGIFIESGIKFDFEMAHFGNTPKKLGNLYEVMDLFKDKIACPTERMKHVKTAAHFTFELGSWSKHFICNWPSQKNLLFNISEFIEDSEKFRRLLFSPSAEMIKKLTMNYTWFYQSEGTLKDSPYYSNYESCTPSSVDLKIDWASQVQSLFIQSLRDLYEMNSKWLPKRQLVKSNETDYTQVDARSALNKIVNRNPLDISFEDGGKQIPIDQELRSEMLNFIFARDDDEDYPPEEHKQFKSSPVDSLVYRLALLITFINFKYNNWCIISTLWRDLISQFRRFWESNEFIPDIDHTNQIDLQACSIYQSLQMLNCCISAKREKEMKVQEENEEFYDCEEDEEEFLDSQEQQPIVPEGVLEKHAKLFLLCGKPMNVPFTQECAPQTEKMIEEQMTILSQITDSKESSAIRAKLQCASLVSDMEAFKAANPECIFEDFIRWHSPRDFLPQTEQLDGSITGELSMRFSDPDCLWIQLWNDAKAVPANKQKPLFDYTKEAEKILHEFDKFTTNDLVDALFPVFTYFVVRKLVSVGRKYDVLNHEVFTDLKSQVRNLNVDKMYEQTLDRLIQVDHFLLKLHSLMDKLEFAHKLEHGCDLKLNELMKKSIMNLLNNSFLQLTPKEDQELINLIRKCFEIDLNESEYLEENPDYQMKMLPPVKKKFVLSTFSPRPSAFSRELFQYIYCTCERNEFRLAGCFLEDLVYF